MSDKLLFTSENYTVKTVEIEGRKIVYRAFEGISYCENPADPIQKLNLFVPEAYYEGKSVCGYTKDTVPIFMPNTVGGYMPGPADYPGVDRHTGRMNAIFYALERGCVVVSAGVRGRTSGKKSTEFFEGGKEDYLGENTGRMVGRAPAFIVDYKAAIRWLRYNKDRIPGNTDRIITNGTSAGGALSALAGMTGNSADYIPYLEKIGAADERDDIFAASCYCPIHNLENADAAYEWLFCGHNDYHRTKHKKTADGIIRVPDEGMMSEKQIALSKPLKDLFPAYVNSLGLKDADGRALELDENGDGSFKDYVKSFIVSSADREYNNHDIENGLAFLMTPGSAIDSQRYLTVEDGNVIDVDWVAFVEKITRMKAAPAFDALDLGSPENEEFGDENTDGRHFSKFSMEHSAVLSAEMASPKIIKMMNPTLYFGEADSAPHWRIRHGAFDRDTSLAIPVILATLLENNGYDVDFCLPWGLPHSGDYDLKKLFDWIDKICKDE